MFKYFSMLDNIEVESVLLKEIEEKAGSWSLNPLIYTNVSSTYSEPKLKMNSYIL